MSRYEDNEFENEIIINNPDCKGKLYTQRQLNKILKETKSKERKFALTGIVIASVAGVLVGIGGKALHDWHHDNKVDTANIKVDEYFEDFRDSITPEQQDIMDASKYDVQLENGKNAMKFRVKLLTCELCGYDYDKADQIIYSSHWDKDQKKYVGVRINPDNTVVDYDEMSDIEHELAMFITGVSNAESVEDLRELNIRFNEVINDVAHEVYKDTDHVNGRSMN